MTTTNLPARRTSAAVATTQPTPKPKAITNPQRDRGTARFIGWFLIALVVALFAGLMLNLTTA